MSAGRVHMSIREDAIWCIGKSTLYCGKKNRKDQQESQKENDREVAVQREKTISVNIKVRDVNLTCIWGAAFGAQTGALEFMR